MKNPAFWVVLAAVGVRLLFASFTGLGIDESYMVAASHQFAASYFDHPLASWWLELSSRAIFGGDAPVIVRLPFIALSAVSSWLLYALTNRLYGRQAGFWAVVAYSISPVFSLAFGSWVLPDGPLDAALLAAAYALARALGIGGNTRPQPGWWALAGLFAGLALLSKYSAALVLAGAVLFLITDPASRPVLRRWWPWAAGLLAVVMFTPVIAWNAAHGWQSFDYQSGRAVGLRLKPLAPFVIWGGEALFILPWLWLPMMILGITALRRGPADRRSWLLAMLAVIPVVLFSLVGIWSATRILYHWATPGYLLLLPLLGDWASRLKPRLRNGVALASAALLTVAAVLIAAETSLAFLPDLDLIFPPGKSPLLQIIDWTSIRTQIAARNADAVAALRWYDAGKIGYALHGDLPVTVFGTAPHEFGDTAPARDFLGKTVLLLAMPGDETAIAAQYAPYFKTLSPAPALTVTFHGAVLLVIPVLLGRDMLQIPPD